MRAVLLADQRIRRLLRDEFVPCWQSVHDTAKVRIEFGDGKVMERTLGGNTVIYLCTAGATVIDVFPGVYTPDDFLRESERARRWIARGTTPTVELLAAWHRQAASGAARGAPNPASLSKAIVESPLRLGIGATRRGTSLGATALLLDASKQAASAASLQRRILPPDPFAGRSPEALGLRFVQRDSANNVRLARPAVHAVLAGLGTLVEPDDIKHLVFERVLETSLRDPYFGLAEVAVPGTRMRAR